MDHAAGAPLGVRQSHPASRSTPTSATVDWDDQPNIHDRRQLHRRVSSDEDDPPVELPLRSRSGALIIATAIVLAFVAVCLSVFLSSIGAGTLVTHDTGRSDVVLRH